MGGAAGRGSRGHRALDPRPGRNDAHEVGTFGAVIEGLATGGLYALLGGAAFLALARLKLYR